MSAGTILGRVVLDNPMKFHCGPNDPVTGYVALTYRPPGWNIHSNPEQLQGLFGPLRILVNFSGRGKTKIRKQRNNSSSTYRGRAPLFSQDVKIHDGPYNSAAGACTRFPFSFNFPAVTQPMAEQGDFRENRMFHEEAGGPLPPTFDASNFGFHKRFQAFVEYRIRASASMPGIKIEISGLGRDDLAHSPAVIYEQPRLPIASFQPPQMQQGMNTFTISNEHLLPEEERPTGFRQKTKFMFSSDKYPVYQFDINTKIPIEIYQGQPLTFELSLHPHYNRCTAPVPPEIKLRWLRYELLEFTEVRSEHGYWSEETDGSKDHGARLSAAILDPQTPFCKANDYTKLVQTREPIMGHCSSFSTYNICRHYKLEVEYSIVAAEKEKYVKRIVPVTLFPPLDDGSVMQAGTGSVGTHALGEASSSSSPAAAAASRDSKAGHAPAETEQSADAALPQYERPPEYDRVLEMRGEDDDESAADGGSGKGKGKAAAV